MILPLKQILSISRPRFWIYLLGPFLIGITPILTSTNINLTQIAIWFIYFSLPANFLVYGINDFSDQDTDQFNPKKQQYEQKFHSSQKRFFLTQALIQAPFIVALFWLSKLQLFLLISFLFFSLGYSLKPIRAKAIPLIDTIFNSLYFIPGLFSYSLLSNKFTDPKVVLAALFWCMAMHAYSAIPDITADQKAKLNTVATMLGAPKTLFFCGLCYLASGIITYYLIGLTSVILTSVYLIMILISYKNLKSNKGIFSIYKKFPLLNTLSGFIIFLTLIT